MDVGIDDWVVGGVHTGSVGRGVRVVVDLTVYRVYSPKACDRSCCTTHSPKHAWRGKKLGWKFPEEVPERSLAGRCGSGSRGAVVYR